MNMTMEQAEKILEQYEALLKRATEIAEKRLELEGISPHYLDYVTFEDGWFEYSYTTYCCGERDTTTGSISIDLLFDENWIESAKKQLEEEKRLEEEAELRRKAMAEEAQKKRDYQQYLNLKKRFGNQVEKP